MAIMVKATKHIMVKRTLESQLTSRSSLPIFCRGDEVFIAILVSFPVCSTIPRMNPEEATTVFAQIVFSSDKPS